MDTRTTSQRTDGFWVTCYTDASFSPKGAGWGVWLRSISGRVVRRGDCPAYVKSSLEAELAAIYAGLFLACSTWGDAVRGVMVRTDCQAAIHLLSVPSVRPRVRRGRPGLVRLVDKIRAIVQERGIALDLRWVRAHQKTNTVQAYLNRTCDRLAAESRRHARVCAGVASGTRWHQPVKTSPGRDARRRP